MTAQTALAWGTIGAVALLVVVALVVAIHRAITRDASDPRDKRGGR